jgi:hypothetical protein
VRYFEIRSTTIDESGARLRIGSLGVFRIEH